MAATDDSSTIENPSMDEEQVSSNHQFIDFFEQCSNKRIINNARQKPEPAVNLQELISAATEFGLGSDPNPAPVNKIKKKTSLVWPDNLELRIGPPVDHTAARNVEPRLGQRPELFQVKKVLQTSDIDGSSRLLLPKVQVEEHILPHVAMENRGAVDGDGLEIGVWDLDTNTRHMLVLKRWKSSRGYVLTRNWTSDFVRRRSLTNGDQVGLRWDPERSRMEFAMLEHH